MWCCCWYGKVLWNDSTAWWGYSYTAGATSSTQKEPCKYTQTPLATCSDLKAKGGVFFCNICKRSDSIVLQVKQKTLAWMLGLESRAVGAQIEGHTPGYLQDASQITHTPISLGSHSAHAQYTSSVGTCTHHMLQHVGHIHTSHHMCFNTHITCLQPVGIHTHHMFHAEALRARDSGTAKLDRVLTLHL